MSAIDLRAALAGREIIFEHVGAGEAVKVSAIDVRSAIEVSVMGPRHTAPEHLERLALGKLARALCAAGEVAFDRNPSDPPQSSQPTTRRGRLV